MKIVFYSTNSQSFENKNFHYYNFPDNCELLSKLIEKYTTFDKSLQIEIITQIPAFFLLDIKNNHITNTNPNIKYTILDNTSIENFVEAIINSKPDYAIAISYWDTPYDWLCLNDSLIAEKLEEVHIKTICNSSYINYTCFDKWQTHTFLENNHFNVSKAIQIQQQLFFTEKTHNDIYMNVYKTYVLTQLKKMQFPIVIKNKWGLSSYGVDVLTTYKQAVAYLNSKKNNSDKIIEEYITGLHFGTEILGMNGNYTVFNPFMFSVNQYGITSPKQSVKLGPINEEYSFFKIKELKQSLKELAKVFNFCGVIQVDLVFELKTKSWYIIEINPRLSGMSNCIAQSCNTSPLDLMTSLIFPQQNSKILQKGLFFDIKFPILEEEKIKQIKKIEYVKSINQIRNENARQKREEGYCEIIIGSKEDNIESLLNKLEDLNIKFADIIEESFYEKAKGLANLLQNK